MISDQDIHDALGQVVQTLGYRLHFEGDQSLPKRPYLALQLVPASVRDRSLKGTSPAHRGFLQVSVCVAGGAGPMIGASARRIAEEVMALFEPDPATGRQKYQIPGGEVTAARAVAKAGYHDGTGHRVPVQIPYRAN